MLVNLVKGTAFLCIISSSSSPVTFRHWVAVCR